MFSRILSLSFVLSLAACAVDSSPITPDGDIPADASGDAIFPDATLDAGDTSVADAAPDASPPDAMMDGAGGDAAMDAAVDGATDAGPDGATDAAMDATADAMADATADAMVDAVVDAVVDAPACVDGTTRCAGSMLETCTAGAWVASACPLGCSDVGGAHCLELVPSNVSTSLFVSSGTIRVDADATWDTDACGALPLTGMVVSQGMGYPELCVVSANRFFVDAGYTLTVTGSRPLVVLADTRVEIDGVIDVSATERFPGPGGFAMGDASLIASSGAGMRGSHDGTYDDGGGGGGGLCANGGDGGDGDDASGGNGGGAPGASWNLTPLAGGWPGGQGGSGASAGTGGGGGGALQISVRGVFILRGQILAGGGGGDGGNDGTSGDWNIGSGGGGGSGGAVLIEAETITLASGAYIRANGGGGGGAAGCLGRGNGLDGTDGRDDPTRPPGGSRGRSCSGGANYGANGGAGGGVPIDGANGDGNTRSDANGGGGGGGAGCILIRDATGTLPGGLADTSPMDSPALRASMIAVE